MSQYLSASRLTYYVVVLRILRYLEGTLFHGLFYFAQSSLILHVFSDVNWAEDPIDRRSTTGYCFLLSSFLISWRSKKQTHVACSSTEVEYRALTDTTSELVWLQWLLKDLDVFTSSATPLYCDNQSAIHIAHNDVFHERTKHIEIDCHFIRYHLIHGALKLISISSKDQLANIFTNSHPLLLLFIVTTRVPFMLLTMMSSMNELNTSRSIIILFVIILFMVLSSWS